MKMQLVAVLLAALLVRAAAAEMSDATVKLKEFAARVETKVKDGKKSEKDLADELKEFEALLAKHKEEKTDDVAEVLWAEAMVYLQVFENTEKGVELLKRLKRDFPDTRSAQSADQMLESIPKQEQARGIQRELIEGAKFPDFNEEDVAGKPLSVSSCRGKVVLVDFWATWCAPCVGELPNILKIYEKHHSQGFEIIGISLDKDESKLTAFTRQKKMGWRQIFDGKGAGSKLADNYGIITIPATFLLDAEGKIIAEDLKGNALEEAVAKALARKSVLFSP